MSGTITTGLTDDDVRLLKKLLPIFDQVTQGDRDARRLKAGSKDPPPADTDGVGWTKFGHINFGEARRLRALITTLPEP